MKNIIFIIYLLFVAQLVVAQENVGPIHSNPWLYKNTNVTNHTRARTTAATPLSLPFFEDFTAYNIYPDSNKWTDYEVFINNTMGASPISRGVATFDDLDPNGIPYDSFSNTAFRYTDSLTSQPIDLSTTGPGDSVYLSFFYQPQGNGFYPLVQDSLMLYMRTQYGGFVKVWSVPGSSLQPFQQVMLPITDSLYFHNAFQFRFVNIAALYWADAVWNVDYIKLDKNRNAGDTAINDVAFTANPSFLLNDYTSMPYSQYTAAPLSETVGQVRDSVRNNIATPQTVNYFYAATDLTTGTPTPLFTAGGVSLTAPQFQTIVTPESFSIPTLPVYPANTKVTFESKYYMSQVSALDPTDNDTVVKQQVFDNYLAYDDGSAEKSYYLNLFPTLPGLIEIEFHLNHPDTLRGLAIYFGRQIPFSSSKAFSINIYSALAGINGAPADVPIYISDLLTPGYVDTVNHFWYYTFDTPRVLQPGTFYAGTMQCAGCGADSLYIGLDVNRIGTNHAYYNVLGAWSPSLISGALMIRPLLGGYVHGTGIDDLPMARNNWQVIPNPAKDLLQFNFKVAGQPYYRVTDITGHTLLTGTIANGKTIDVSQLVPGMYFVSLTADGITGAAQKIIKQ